jgi:hypothetical protein
MKVTTLFTRIIFKKLILDIIFYISDLDCFLNFCDAGVWTQVLHLEPLHHLFCDGIFQDNVSQSICLGWLRTMILLISASWVVRITAVSDQIPKFSFFLTYFQQFVILQSQSFLLLLVFSLQIFIQLMGGHIWYSKSFNSLDLKQMKESMACQKRHTMFWRCKLSLSYLNFRSIIPILKEKCILP